MLPGWPTSTNRRATRCVQSSTWRRLLLYNASQPFSLVSSSGEENTPPALLTRIDGTPSSVVVRSSAASTCSPSLTSVMIPSAPMASAADVQVSGLRSQIATRAPNAARPSAMPRPRPSPPPVTTATRPVSRMSDGSMAIAWKLSDLRAVHGRCGADYALRLQFVDVLVTEPQFGQQLAVVLPEQRCGPQVNPIGSTGGRERQGAVRCARVHRVVDVLEEAAGGQLRQLGLTMGLHDLGDRYAASPQRLDNAVAGAGFAPGAQVLVDQIVVRAAHFRCAELGQPVGPVERVTQSGPLLVGRDGNGDPAVSPAELVDLVGAIQVLRRSGGPSVAVALEDGIVRRVLDQLLGGDVERGVDHRRLDVH